MARTRHHQAGYVFRKGSNWYVRYREDVQLENGSVQRIQKCHKLAEASGQYRTRDAAEELAEEFIRSVNRGDVRPESTMSLNRFIEDCYLPYVEQQKRRSTYCGYKNLWLRYVQPNGGVALREVRTFEAEQMLKDIARRENLSRTTLGHIKHFLSGAFRYARRQGVLDNANPMHDVEIPKARPAGETYAYSLEEEAQMLTILPEPTATVVATADSAPRKRQHDDEHLREDGECGRSECDEVPGNNVCNYCATREARKYANYVEVLSLGSQQTSMLDAVTRIWRRGGDSNPRYKF
jgi:hypothetical protein